MSDCSDDDYIESLELESHQTPPRPIPRARPSFKSPSRSVTGVSPTANSVLSLSGDRNTLCLQGQTNGIDVPTLTQNYTATDKTGRFPSVIQLNVGGIKYMTRLSTLKKYPDSMLAALFSGRYQVDKDAEGNYFLDSNGILFGYLLEFLRNGLLPPREQSVALYREASYYGIHELIQKLQYMPPVVAVMVKDAHKSQFPNYQETKEDVIKIASEKATYTKVGEVLIYAFKTEFVPKVNTFNPNHGCVIESADVKIGPWDSPVDEEVFIRCLETDLMEEGFTVKPHETKRKCRYYHGQSCQKFVYRLQILF